ncbi:MAG: 50S ribosomal protein L9 [bacterium]
MEVILTKNIDNLGEAGKVVHVAPGFARNYLFPKKIAMKATPENMAILKKHQSFMKSLEMKAKKEFEELAAHLEKLSLTFSRKAGESDRLFGSVTNLDIASALENEGVRIDKRKITLDEPIKALGIYKVPLKLHPEVTAHLKVWVIKDDSAPAKGEDISE